MPFVSRRPPIRILISPRSPGARQACFCEKPLALKAEECAHRQKLAAQKKKILMVGRTYFIFNAGIKTSKRICPFG